MKIGLKEILIGGLLVAFASGSPISATSSPSPPNERIVLNRNDKINNPTGASSVRAADLPRFNAQATVLNLQRQYKDQRIKILDPISQGIDALEHKIAYIRKYPGAQGAEALAFYSFELAKLKAEYDRVYQQIFFPLNQQILSAKAML